MAALFANLGAALTGNALKWGLGLMLLMCVGGGSFVWGENRATGIAAAAAATDADARVAAAQKSDQAMLADYLAKLSAQTARGDALGAALAADDNKFAAAANADKEKLVHAVSQNSACDLPAAALSLLDAQPARH